MAVSWGSDPEFFGPRHAVREAMVVRRLAAVCPPPARVLDAGSGPGHLSHRLAALGYAVVGVDASAAFVAYAARPGGTNPRFAHGDLTALAEPDGGFDAVVAGEVLEHVEDHERAVAELFRVLAPGGWVVATVPADPALWDASDDWAGHRRRYGEADLRGLLAGRGFEVVALVRWGFPVVRLYHRLVYLPMLARKVARPEAGPSPPLAGWRKRAAQLVAAGMRLDGLFDGSPWGIGWLVVARKPGGPAGIST